MDSLEKIKTLRDRILTIKEHKVSLETQLTFYKQEREKLKQELLQLGLQPVELADYLQKADVKLKELEDRLGNIEQALNERL
jgi:chromosome segregation ATPase